MSRSASPSRANPTSAPWRTTASARDAGSVAPHRTLMLIAVRVGMDDLDRRAGRLEDRRTEHRAGAIRAVEDDAQAAGRDRAGHGRRGARDTPRRGRARRRPGRGRRSRPAELVGPPDRAARARPRRRRRASGRAASRTLRPLSSAGLCDAETMIPPTNIPRPPGTRGPVSGRRRPRGRRCRGSSPRPRSRPRTCRPSDACPGRRPALPRPPEVARRGPAEGEGERRLEVDVGDPTDPVRPEQSWHWRQPRWGPATDRPRPGATTSTLTVGGLDVTSVRPAGRTTVTGPRWRTRR